MRPGEGEPLLQRAARPDPLRRRGDLGEAVQRAAAAHQASSAASAVRAASRSKERSSSSDRTRSWKSANASAAGVVSMAGSELSGCRGSGVGRGADVAGSSTDASSTRWRLRPMS
ncbi:hypothetical protein ACFW6F_26730 [Streptomyces sp. NPDC058746]|uniref:hypothetical protein n=1 Tax=Streptomyces sp. NPDC058746 TaxID=3346622 RepID=UPI0036C68DC9